MERDKFFEWYFSHKRVIEITLLSLLLLVNFFANGFTAQVEGARVGIDGWEPWLWELTSILSITILLPSLAWLSEKYPLKLVKVRNQIVLHFFGSIIFFIAHISIMVTLRFLVYASVGMDYDFEWQATSLFYEFSKDVRIYIFFILVFNAYRFIIRRWRGEASTLSEQPDYKSATEKEKWLNQVLIKMLNREFLIDLNTVQFIRSSGNYQELYIDLRAYPLRITQYELLERLDPSLFRKISRSTIVNLNFIKAFHINPDKKGILSLNDGTELTVQKKYLDNLPDTVRYEQP